MNIHWKEWCWNWSSNLFCWERLKARGEGVDRGWDGWMASPTQWTWVWESSGRWWRTGKHGVLQPMGSQRVTWVRKIPWRRGWLSIPVFFPGEFHRLRSPAGYSPWDGKESDKTKWQTLSFFSLCVSPDTCFAHLYLDLDSGTAMGYLNNLNPLCPSIFFCRITVRLVTTRQGYCEY